MPSITTNYHFSIYISNLMILTINSSEPILLLYIRYHRHCSISCKNYGQSCIGNFNQNHKREIKNWKISTTTTVKGILCSDMVLWTCLFAKSANIEKKNFLKSSTNLEMDCESCGTIHIWKGMIKTYSMQNFMTVAETDGELLHFLAHKSCLIYSFTTTQPHAADIVQASIQN